MEFLYVLQFHPHELSWNSFLLNVNYPEYQMALGLSFVEYFVELYFFPSMKSNSTLLVISTIGTIVFQGVRSGAMWTAGHNFHHYVRETREKGHVLVTHGIYAYLRHPSYFGWFWWAVCTQLAAANPISMGVFAYGLWKFFSDRIVTEEQTLVEFFGQNYRDYQKKVPVLIPFIK